MDCGYSLEPLRRSIFFFFFFFFFLSRNIKKLSEFLSENFQLLVVKFSISYLNNDRIIPTVGFLLT